MSAFGGLAVVVGVRREIHKSLERIRKTRVGEVSVTARRRGKARCSADHVALPERRRTPRHALVVPRTQVVFMHDHLNLDKNQPVIVILIVIISGIPAGAASKSIMDKYGALNTFKWTILLMRENNPAFSLSCSLLCWKHAT